MASRVPSRSDGRGEGLPRSRRLRTSPEFQRVQSGGRRIHGRNLVVVYRTDDARPAGDVRFGLAVSRKVGSAVVRNRVKRWLREAARRQRSELSSAPAVDIVLIARPSAASAGYGLMYDEVAAALAAIRKEIG